MNGKFDWVARIRPTAIVFGVLLTAIAMGGLWLIYHDLNAADPRVAMLLGGIIGMVVTKLGDALTSLIAKNGGE